MDLRPPTTPKLRPRDFQFSLTRLLVAMTVCAVVCAFRLPAVFTLWLLLPVVILVLFSDWSVWHLIHGNAAFRAGHYRRAVQAFSRAIEADPEDPERYCRRAIAHQSQKDLEAAIADYAKATSLDARYAAAWVGRASVESARGEYQRAIDDATIALCLTPGSLDAILIRGSCYSALGQFDDALEDLDEAVRLDSDRWRGRYVRGEAYLAARQYRAALRDFEEAAQLGAAGGDVLVGRSIASFKLGRYGEAFREIGAYVADDPQSAQALCAYAWFLAACPDDSFRDGRQALELARAAERLSDRHSCACETALAAAYAELGEFHMAVEHAQKAIDLAPVVARAECELRLAMYQAGQPYRDLRKIGHG